jgi:hypothetical protein
MTGSTLELERVGGGGIEAITSLVYTSKNKALELVQVSQIARVCSTAGQLQPSREYPLSLCESLTR